MLRENEVKHFKTSNSFEVISDNVFFKNAILEIERLISKNHIFNRNSLCLYVLDMSSSVVFEKINFSSPIGAMLVFLSQDDDKEFFDKIKFHFPVRFVYIKSSIDFITATVRAMLFDAIKKINSPFVFFDCDFFKLSQQEIKAINYYMQELSFIEISKCMCRDVKTVYNYIRSAFKKINMKKSIKDVSCVKKILILNYINNFSSQSRNFHFFIQG